IRKYSNSNIKVKLKHSASQVYQSPPCVTALPLLQKAPMAVSRVPVTFQLSNATTTTFPFPFLRSPPPRHPPQTPPKAPLHPNSPPLQQVPPSHHTPPTTA